MNSGIVFNIKKYALHDGPGIRTTIFLKGCPLRCAWCHNPESQSPIPQRVSRVLRAKEERASGAETGGNGGGMVRPDTETIGREMTVAEVMAEVRKDSIFYDESGGGATFSGGEPLSQPRFLEALLRACRAEEIHTVVDTSGYVSPEVVEAIAPLADLFYYDLKLMDDAAHRQWTGAGNGRVLDTLRRIAGMGRPVMIRFPLIPGITDGPGNLRAIADFTRSLKTVTDIAVLPYHAIASAKYEKLGMENRMGRVSPPDDSAVAEAAAFFTTRGFTVTVGG